MQIWSTVGIGIGVGVLGIVAVILMFMRPHGAVDLGSVSDQWIAQHRAGQAHDLQH